MGSMWAALPRCAGGRLLGVHRVDAGLPTGGQWLGDVFPPAVQRAIAAASLQVSGYRLHGGQVIGRAVSELSHRSGWGDRRRDRIQPAVSPGFSHRGDTGVIRARWILGERSSRGYSCPLSVQWSERSTTVDLFVPSG